MKLWILQAKDEELQNNDNPWVPWYDRAFGHVVRAETEEDARKIAHENAGFENQREFMQPWKDQKYSTCVELSADGEHGLILTDFRAG
ncbi:MAG: hypothetical protein GY941_13635 [Planctomycetes bacterium]|nr:hypothetical protein [Planctomycetota bacterium]